MPDVALHALRGREFSGADVLILTLLLPLMTVEACTIFRNFLGPKDGRVFVAITMTLGIWLLGPLFMVTSATFSGGGFSQPGGWELVKLGTLLFPAFTFMMSAYDGSLFAVLLTSLSLILISAGKSLRRINQLP
jgi:hypothetical protein